MGNPNHKSFMRSVKVARWLEQHGAMENPSLRARYVHMMRTGNNESFMEYVTSHPSLIRAVKLRQFHDKEMEANCPFYPFPNASDFNGNMPLGFVNPNDDLMMVSESDLNRHMLIEGKTGAGKSNFLKILLKSVYHLANGLFWIFDPNREYRQIKNHFPNTVVLRVREFWDNPFERPDPKIPHLEWLEAVSQVIETELGFQLASRMLLYDTGKYILKKRGVLEGSNDTPTCLDFLNVLQARRHGKGTSYQKDSYKPLVDRMTHLLSVGDYFATQKSIPMETLLQKNIIFEFDGFSDEVYTLIMGLLISKAYYYRMWNPQACGRLHMNVIEEGRVPLSSNRQKGQNIKEPVLSKLMAQYRKFGGSFVVLTQEPSSILTTVKSNAHTIVGFPLTEGGQIGNLGRTMLLTREQLDYFTSLGTGTALVKYGGMKPFILRVPKFPESNKEELTNADIAAETESFLAPFRRKTEYKPWADEESKPSSRKSTRRTKDTPDPDAMKVIYSLIENPFQKYTELLSACGFGVSRLNKACALLEKQGLVCVEKIKVSKAKPSKFIVLEDKAFELTGGKRPEGKGSFKSRMYCHLVKRWLLKNGWQAKVEGTTEHDSKLIDVLAKKEPDEYIAYEITNSFSNLCQNIQTDLLGSKVSKVVVVVENASARKKAESVIENILPELAGKTVITTINRFF